MNLKIFYKEIYFYLTTFFKDLFLFMCILVCCVCAHICAHVFGSLQEKVLDALELE